MRLGNGSDNHDGEMYVKRKSPKVSELQNEENVFHVVVKCWNIKIQLKSVRSVWIMMACWGNRKIRTKRTSNERLTARISDDGWAEQKKSNKNEVSSWKFAFDVWYNFVWYNKKLCNIRLDYLSLNDFKK